MQRVYLAVCRKPIDDLPWWVKTLLRWVYHRYGWAASSSDWQVDATKLATEHPELDLRPYLQPATYQSIEYRGVFRFESDARWAASCPGGSYTELPLDDLLPEETVQLGTHDFPLSEESANYRNRKLALIAVPRAEVERLQESLARTKLA